MATVEDHPPLSQPGQSQAPDSPATSLLSGMILMVVFPVLVMLLAYLNCALLTASLRLIGAEETPATKGWIHSLIIVSAIAFAIAQVAAYELFWTRTVDLVPPIQAALQEMCDVVQTMEDLNRLEQPYLPVLSERLRLLKAVFDDCRGPVSYCRFKLTLEGLREVLIPRVVLLEEAKCDHRLQGLNSLLERYQRQRFSVVVSLFPTLKQGQGTQRAAPLRNTKPSREWGIKCLLEVLVDLDRLLPTLKASLSSDTDQILVLINATIEKFYTRKYNLPDALLFGWLSRVVDKACAGRLHDRLSDEGSDRFQNISRARDYVELVLSKKLGHRVGGSAQGEIQRLEVLRSGGGI